MRYITYFELIWTCICVSERVYFFESFPIYVFFFLSVKCFYRNFGLTSGHCERPIKFALVIHFFIYFSGKKIVNNIYHILKKRTGSYFLKMLRSRH